MIPQVPSEYLEHGRGRPLAAVNLSRSDAQEHGTSGVYIPNVNSPVMLIKRFFMLYPKLSERDCKLLIEESLKDVPNPSQVASKILHIEKRLMNIVLGTTATSHERTLERNRKTNLGNATVRWLSHLFPSSFGGRLNVRILDQGYVSQLVDLLKHVSTPADVADYFHFRTLVEYSPFLNMTHLIPLSYDSHVRAVPLRVQGCLHLVENFYKHGMRMLGIEALGGDIAAWQIPFRHEIEVLFSDVRHTLHRFVRSWFSSSTVDMALRKLRSMKLAYLGSDVAYPTSYAVYTPELSSLDNFGDLVRDAVQRDFNETANYDFLYRASIFSTSVEYNADTNTIYVPHALVTIPALFSEVLHPIFIPILGAKMLQGVLAAVDVRGSTTVTEDSGWWHMIDRLKFQNRSVCFREELDREVNKISPSANFSGFLHSFMAESAAIEPLLDIYKQRVYHRFPKGFKRSAERRNEKRIFYYAYAMGQCEEPGTESIQIRFRHAIPARIRVNSALANDPGFQKTFLCKAHSRMAPDKRCSYWEASSATNTSAPGRDKSGLR
ncbi:hypothetical protein HPB48_022402 [Haemaphysalis longicornis]|uniref:Uncharacterized protein n=1 Tax=Haemaphysalis longicornis TaxID=44386 RepID=A0A9J6G2N5_HAELO|nr:hypothetical protein HPB48_022402 [Haemaphysalis longicornis]